MGTFSSKMRLSTSDSNRSDHRHSKSDGKQNGLEENSKLSTQTGAARHEDKSKVKNTSEELPRESKVVQSFGWLMETPVAQPSTSKEPRDLAKPPCRAKRKSKTTNVLAYSNGKYLKSAELVHSTSSTKSKKRVKILAGTPPQSSSQRKCFVHVEKRSNKTESEQKIVNEDIAMPSRPDVGYGVGFGVIGKSDSDGRARQDESEDNGGEDEHKAKGKYPTIAKGGKHSGKQCQKKRHDC